MTSALRALCFEGHVIIILFHLFLLLVNYLNFLHKSHIS